VAVFAHCRFVEHPDSADPSTHPAGRELLNPAALNTEQQSRLLGGQPSSGFTDAR
jgi:hypothetical protein